MSIKADKRDSFTLFSGGAKGAEAFFGEMAERYGLQEVNYSFQGHQILRNHSIRLLSQEELTSKDVNLAEISKHMHRTYSSAPLFRKILESICWQVESGDEIFVVGTIYVDGTVKGGTGWGAEYAKLLNKPVYVFDQVKDGWYTWVQDNWEPIYSPVITRYKFTGTGTRFLEENGQTAIQGLFERTFHQ